MPLGAVDLSNRPHVVNLSFGSKLFEEPSPSHQNAPPPQPPAPLLSPPRARSAVFLFRWRRRAQLLLLQAGAARLGRLTRLRRAWTQYRAGRAFTLARWHKKMRAELHRWSGLMRLVIRAWHAWHRLRGETLQKQAAALQNWAQRLSYRVWRGWRLAVLKRQRQRLALLQYAAALSARCFAHWRLLLDGRRERATACCAAVASASARARPRLGRGAAARRRLAHDEAAATAALGAASGSPGALTARRAARVAGARRAVRAPRVPLHGPAALRALPAGRRASRRAALDAFVPRAAARLLKSRGARLLGRWAAHAAAAARVRQRAARDAVAARRRGRRAAPAEMAARRPPPAGGGRCKAEQRGKLAPRGRRGSSGAPCCSGGATRARWPSASRGGCGGGARSGARSAVREALDDAAVRRRRAALVAAVAAWAAATRGAEVLLRRSRCPPAAAVCRHARALRGGASVRRPD